MALPNFLIAGMPRCGTTAMAQWLRHHPQAFVSIPKELHFFGGTNWERGVSWYRDQFAPGAAAPARGEGTPYYASDPVALDQIAGTLDDPKLIVCVREPVARVYSHWVMFRDTLHIEPRSFEAVMEQELASWPLGCAPPWSRDDAPWHGYLQRGRYAQVLQDLELRFGRERIHVVVNEEMNASPDATFAGVCRFLGIDEVAPRAPTHRINQHHQIGPGWMHRLVLRHRLVKRLPDRLVVPFVRKMARDEYGISLTPELRARLAAIYAPENAELERWLGRSLDWDPERVVSR